jgi:hypothetical protein
MKRTSPSLAGYTTYRTAAPALVRLARHRAAAEAAFIALVLGAGFALDRLAGVVIAVFEQFAK